MKNTLGTVEWGMAAYGKYIFVGDFSRFGTRTIDGRSGDQRLGIYDSESKTFCKLDIEPNPDAVQREATQRAIVVGNPSSRKSRVLFAGTQNSCRADCDSAFCSAFFCSGEAWETCNRPDLCSAQGAAFGWIEADLDSPSPCDTWPAFLGPFFTSVNDGMPLLNHSDTPGDPLGVDTVIVNSYLDSRLNVVRVDAGGAAVVASYDEPSFVQTINGVACTYGRDPLQRPQVDRTRPMNDIRVVISFDLVNSPSVTCPKATFHHSQEYSVDLTASPVTIIPVGPYFGDYTAATSDDGFGGMLMSSANLYNMKTSSTQTCVYDGVSRPAVPGERCFFDPLHADPAHTNAVVTSIAPDEALPIDPSSGPLTEPTYVQHGNTLFFSEGYSSVQRAFHAGSTWLLDDDTVYKVALARGLLAGEARGCAASFSMPPRFCECPSTNDPDVACVDTAHCCDGAQITGLATDVCCDGSEVPHGQSCPPSHEMCQVLPVTSVSSSKDLVWGGAPASLWTAQAINSGTDPIITANLYLLRIPIEADLPDGESEVPVRATWEGGRIWLFGKHNGSYAYRVRDAGLWSSWSNLPTGAPLTDGIATVSAGGGVELFATGTDGALYTSTLTSAIDCAVGACSWSSWAQVPVPTPPTISVSLTPAVAYQGTAAPLIVVRNSADQRLYYTRRVVGSWQSYRPLSPSLMTDLPAAVVYNATTNDFWVAARDLPKGRLRVSRVDPTLGAPAPSAWKAVPGGTGSHLPWGAPALSIERTPTTLPWTIRVFAANGSEDSRVYAATTVATANTAKIRFRHLAPLISNVRAEGGLATTVVNGDTNLFSIRQQQVYESLAK